MVGSSDPYGDQSALKQRIEIGNSLVRFFALLRGQGLSGKELAEVNRTAEQYVRKDETDHLFQKDLFDTFG